MPESKKYKKQDIRELLTHSDKAVLRGLVVINSLQTLSEQESKMTHDHNRVGWSALDAPFMTSCAEQLRERKCLTIKQMIYVRRRIMKYAGQLADVANGKIRVVV